MKRQEKETENWYSFYWWLVRVAIVGCLIVFGEISLIRVLRVTLFAIPGRTFVVLKLRIEGPKT